MSRSPEGFCPFFLPLLNSLKSMEYVLEIRGKNSLDGTILIPRVEKQQDKMIITLKISGILLIIPEQIFYIFKFR